MPKKSSGGQRAAFNPGQHNQLPSYGQQGQMDPLQARFDHAPPMFRMFMQMRARNQGIDPLQLLQQRMMRHQMNTGQIPGQGG